MQLPLIEPNETESRDERIELGPGAFLLRGFALGQDKALCAAIQEVAAIAPFRHMLTPGGRRMSVAMTNCGPLGWVTDRAGYRYSQVDPESQQRWAALPEAFAALADAAARAGGYREFVPDACLVNRYEPGAKMSLHVDQDEGDLTQPIVSVSLGLPAVFQWGGLKRSEAADRLPLTHGDVVVWGGASRLRYHGVSPVKPGEHPLTGAFRYNLTFRKAR